MTIDTEGLRELAAELGFWPATTDEADIKHHRQHNKNADYWLARRLVQRHRPGAVRLQAVIGSRDYSIDIAEMRVQVGKISEAVRSVVPESMRGAIIEKLEELEQHSQALDVGEDAFYADDPL